MEYMFSLDQSYSVKMTSFPCNLVHKVLTSTLITQVYGQNLSH